MLRRTLLAGLGAIFASSLVPVIPVLASQEPAAVPTKLTYRELFTKELEDFVHNELTPTILWEHNTDFLRARARQLTSNKIEHFKEERKCRDFQIVCDERNNTSAIIDSNGFALTMYVSFVDEPSLSFAQFDILFNSSGLSIS